MLRNPEVILECVGLIVSGVKVDMSPHAMDIGNSLIGVLFYTFILYISKVLFLANLHSKDDKARQESAQALKCLAQQISEKKAIEDLLKKIFAVFHGSDGKLTVAEHKISVLEVRYNTLDLYTNHRIN